MQPKLAAKPTAICACCLEPFAGSGLIDPELSGCYVVCPACYWNLERAKMHLYAHCQAHGTTSHPKNRLNPQ